MVEKDGKNGVGSMLIISKQVCKPIQDLAFIYVVPITLFIFKARCYAFKTGGAWET